VKVTHILVPSALSCLLLIMWGGILAPDTEGTAKAARAAPMPTAEATESGYTNYSGYYRMRCWPACHTKDIPESMKVGSEPEAPGYTNYSGYYRMRCWPACHTRDIPESMQPDQPESHSYTNYSGYYRMRCWPACHTKDIPESMQTTD
jgi:hypothetical protein